MKKAGIVLVAIGLAGFVAASFMPPGFERYCYLYAGIDTRYAPGFSEGKFERIRPGMTMAEVRSILGAPLDESATNNSTRWSYTGDRKCTWADWAWLSREVTFVEGRVSEKIARVYYD